MGKGVILNIDYFPSKCSWKMPKNKGTTCLQTKILSRDSFGGDSLPRCEGFSASEHQGCPSTRMGLGRLSATPANEIAMLSKNYICLNLSQCWDSGLYLTLFTELLSSNFSFSLVVNAHFVLFLFLFVLPSLFWTRLMTFSFLCAS